MAAAASRPPLSSSSSFSKGSGKGYSRGGGGGGRGGGNRKEPVYGRSKAFTVEEQEGILKEHELYAAADKDGEAAYLANHYNAGEYEDDGRFAAAYTADEYTDRARYEDAAAIFASGGHADGLNGYIPADELVSDAQALRLDKWASRRGADTVLEEYEIIEVEDYGGSGAEHARMVEEEPRASPFAFFKATVLFFK